jgi:hypothetical protein
MKQNLLELMTVCIFIYFQTADQNAMNSNITVNLTFNNE